MASHQSVLRSILKEASPERPLLSIFLTAGYPELESTEPLLQALNEEGVDFIELGFPFSDPIADGSTIQESSEQALKNGMHLELLFNQISKVSEKLKAPLLLMGYLNPVLRYGKEKFLARCEECGVSGLILPDLPFSVYKREWKEELEKRNIGIVFLVTPSTAEERIREIDAENPLFIYAVSSYSLTGSSITEQVEGYLGRLKSMSLTSPLVVGFGIRDKESFLTVTKYARGAIIGSAFLSSLSGEQDAVAAARMFVRKVLSVP